ncbi:MAG TPA: M56 family metallopeptidase [Solirubrobacterales bacterium]|nr:M56 family metallopeptidase [Solirubrobacterales bacterium]
MRGAGRLYLLHVALAGVGAILLAGGTAMIFSRQSFSVPTSQAVSDACHNWLTAGGPAALLGLSVAALALAAVCLGLRSVHRQVRATSRYLATQDLSAEPVEVDGIPCRLIDSEEPRAFCAGYLRPRVYLSRGAQEQLEDDELRAVLAHEGHHLRRRDPLRLLVAHALADSLFFVPIFRRISERFSALGELAADEAAVKAVGGRGPLASALLKFSSQPAAVVSLAPERVDHLMGDPDATLWKLPRSPLARSAIALAALGAVSLLIWHGILDPNLQVPLLVAAACAGMMVCGPIALALGALLLSRHALRRRLA